MKYYSDFFKRRLSHLDPLSHNIFSLNHVSTQRVNGLFLSSQSVFKLFSKGNQFKVTEELINFFVDCFNFYSEYDHEEGILNYKLPDILFCKSTDDVAKINVLYQTGHHLQHLNKAVPKQFTADEEIAFVNELKIWYGSDFSSHLDSAINKYRATSTHIKQICVPINGHQWSIIDVKVDIFDPETKYVMDGFVQEVKFRDMKSASISQDLDAIENRTLYSAVWWAKYFGLYSCQHSVNGENRRMYFGTNDIHLTPPVTGESSALDISETKICKQNGTFGLDSDFSLQSLVVMLNRLKNKNLMDSEVVECYEWTRFLVIEFLITMLKLFMPEEFDWYYDHKAKGLPRNDPHWRALFLSSNTDHFDINNFDIHLNNMVSTLGATAALKPSGVTAEHLSKIWKIDVTTAENTLDVTTQLLRCSQDPTLL